MQENSIRDCVVASPIIPCGRSWVDSCLMELGCMWSFCDAHVPYEHIWEREHDDVWTYKWRNTPLGFDLMYPALMREMGTTFDQDLRARATHYAYHSLYDTWKGVYMVRHFRDALYSAYVRQRPDVEFSQFIRWREPYTLLPIVDYMAVHSFVWMSRPNVLMVRFEDYRAASHKTLQSICDHLTLNCGADRIASAILNSSYSAMRDCELANCERVYGSPQAVFIGDGIVNRAGGMDSQLNAEFHDIEEVGNFVLAKLGYKVATDAAMKGFSPQLKEFMFQYSDISSVLGACRISDLPVDAEASTFLRDLETERQSLRKLRAQLEAVESGTEDVRDIDMYGWRDSYTRKAALRAIENFLGSA